jgi:sulfite exporter TauE/SafE
MEFVDSSPAIAIASLAGAFGAGLGGSLHCVLMCGPLACAAAAKGTGGLGSTPLLRGAAWHAARIAGYAGVGGLLGLFGQGVSTWLATSVQPYLPWLVALGLVASAFDWAKRMPAIPGLRHVSAALARVSSRFSPLARSALLGMATPFLPCGLLYGLFLAAAATASVRSGALVMAAFALGAVPAFVLLQSGSGSLERWPRLVPVLRRGVPLAAAAVVVWRALAATGAPGVPGVPMHHH